MSSTIHSTGKCCGDCLMFLANGEPPLTDPKTGTDMSEADTQAWIAEFQRQTEGLDVTLGMSWSEHSDDCDAQETGGDCECEQLGFSWSQCETCGSGLGGDRYAVTFVAVES